MTVVVPDVSEFNAKLGPGYNRPFTYFRACDGTTYADQHFDDNVAYTVAQKAKGAISGGLVYHVYRPGSMVALFNYLWNRFGGVRPAWLLGVVIDMEGWGGEIRGDQSGPANQLAGMHAAKLGSWQSVLGYANGGDWAKLWPGCDPRIRRIRAAYGGKLSINPANHEIGQQYTDGQYQVAGLPSATAPMGPCDHNAFNYLTPAQMVADLAPNLGGDGFLAELTDTEQRNAYNMLLRMSAALDDGTTTPVAMRGEVTHRLRAIQTVTDVVKYKGVYSAADIAQTVVAALPTTGQGGGVTPQAVHDTLVEVLGKLEIKIDTTGATA